MRFGKHWTNPNTDVVDPTGRKMDKTHLHAVGENTNGSYEKHCVDCRCQNIKLFECSDCDQRFSNHVELECHIKLAHSEKEPFQCTDCEASYSSQEELNDHKKKKMRFDIWCSICTDSHKTLESFTSCVSSKNKIDKKKKNWNCNICQKKFRMRHKMAEHISNVHKYKWYSWIH